MKLNKLGTDNVNVCNALFYLPSAVTLVGEGWPGPCLPEKPLSFILNLEERMMNATSAPPDTFWLSGSVLMLLVGVVFVSLLLATTARRKRDSIILVILPNLKVIAFASEYNKKLLFLRY